MSIVRDYRHLAIPAPAPPGPTDTPPSTAGPTPQGSGPDSPPTRGGFSAPVAAAQLGSPHGPAAVSVFLAQPPAAAYPGPSGGPGNKPRSLAALGIRRRALHVPDPRSACSLSHHRCSGSASLSPRMSLPFPGIPIPDLFPLTRSHPALGSQEMHVTLKHDLENACGKEKNLLKGLK